MERSGMFVNTKVSDWVGVRTLKRNPTTKYRTISFLSTPSNNFQIRMVLNTSNFAYSEVMADGGDIRFYSDSSLQVPISYWIESWSYNGTSVIWFKVPSSGATNVYMSYGNPGSVTTSSIDSTMDPALQFMYYGGTGFNTLDGGGQDQNINYNWGSGTVNFTNYQTGSGFGGRADSVSIRWRGFIKPSATGTTTFYATSDDGQRLYVGGTLIIDNWNDQGPTERAGSFNFTDLTPRTIQYDWYENGGGAYAALGWATPNIGKTYPIGGTYYRGPKYDGKYGDTFTYTATVGAQLLA